MKHFAAAAVAATLLAGCANPGANRQAAIKDAFTRLSACTDEVANRPEYAAVRAHFLREITAGALADNRLPTPEEARLVLRRFDAEVPCRKAFITAFASPLINRRDAAQIYSASFDRGALFDARFARGDLTWGQYAQSAQALVTAVRAQLKEAVAEGRQEDAEDRREAADRALDAEAVISVMQPHPAPQMQIAPFSCSGSPSCQ